MEICITCIGAGISLQLLDMKDVSNSDEPFGSEPESHD